MNRWEGSKHEVGPDRSRLLRTLQYRKLPHYLSALYPRFPHFLRRSNCRCVYLPTTQRRDTTACPHPLLKQVVDQ